MALRLCEKCNKIVSNTRGYCFFCGNNFDDLKLNKCPECGSNITNMNDCKNCGFEIKKVEVYDPDSNKIADDAFDLDLNITGNILTFGRYPQNLFQDTNIDSVPVEDRNTLKDNTNMFCENYVYSKNGSRVKWYKYDPIKWIILVKKDGKALIISQAVIQAKRFAGSTNSYEASEVREFLNGFFYNNAFNEAERKLIINTEVDNSAKTTDNKKNKYACNNTYDNIFLLSYEEIKKYFKNDGARQASTTYFCGENRWWTRSPYSGSGVPYNPNMQTNSISETGTFLQKDCDIAFGLRPACWIKLK